MIKITGCGRVCSLCIQQSFMPRYSSFASHKSMNLWLSEYLNVLGFAFLTGKPAFKFYFHNLTLMTKLCGNDFNSEKSVLLHKSNIKIYFNSIDTQSLICNSKTFLKGFRKSNFFFIISLVAKPDINWPAFVKKLDLNWCDTIYSLCISHWV